MRPSDLIYLNHDVCELKDGRDRTQEVGTIGLDVSSEGVRVLVLGLALKENCSHLDTAA